MVAGWLSRCLVLVCFALASGCSAMSPSPIAFLEAAIAAIDSGDTLCEATEFSTDDQQVLAVLRERDFDVVAYKTGEGDEGEHQFILRQRNSQMLLSADVVAVRGECSTYTFARIAQAE